MKKFIFTLLTLCVSITVDAQSWIVDTIAGDELLGTKSCIGYAFQDVENGKEFIIYDNNNEDFYLCVESKYLILTVAVLQAVKWSELSRYL